MISFTAVDPAADAVVFTVAGSHGTLDDSVQTTAKLTPFDQYPRKGRATGGVRCQRFLKGEDCLSLAWAGAVPARAAQKNGTPAELPEIDPRRDGSGMSLAKPVCGGGGPGLGLPGRIPTASSPVSLLGLLYVAQDAPHAVLVGVRGVVLAGLQLLARGRPCRCRSR